MPLRKNLRRVAKSLRPVSYATGSMMLRSKSLRSAFNQAYEKLGPAFDDTFNLLFDDSDVPCDFEWKCGFHEKEFVLPVYSDFQRSWNNARVWRWSGNRAIRKFYEFYLGHHNPGTFFDIGANDGTHSYPFASAGYTCVCVEPQPSCADYIRRTSKLNNFDKLLVIEGAMSRSDGDGVEFFVSKSSWYSSLNRESVERFEPVESIRVRTIALDSYCREHRIEPSLVKIDVERSEWEVIEGGANTFGRFKPDLFVEVSSEELNKERVWGFFSALGYRLYYVRHYSERPFHATRSLQEFLDAGRENANGDFIVLAESSFVSDFERLIQETQGS